MDRTEPAGRAAGDKINGVDLVIPLQHPFHFVVRNILIVAGLDIFGDVDVRIIRKHRFAPLYPHFMIVKGMGTRYDSQVAFSVSGQPDHGSGGLSAAEIIAADIGLISDIIDIQVAAYDLDAGFDHVIQLVTDLAVTDGCDDQTVDPVSPKADHFAELQFRIIAADLADVHIDPVIRKAFISGGHPFKNLVEKRIPDAVDNSSDPHRIRAGGEGLGDGVRLIPQFGRDRFDPGSNIRIDTAAVVQRTVDRAA